MTPPESVNKPNIHSKHSLIPQGTNKYAIAIGFRNFQLCLKEKSWLFPTPDGGVQKQIHRLQRSPTMLERIVMNVSDPGRGRTKHIIFNNDKLEYVEV